MTAAPIDTVLPQHRSHSRRFAEHRFVYPVVSRRSRGISIGVNLNPDKVCNFDCIYCQVDRRSTVETRFVEIDQMLAELAAVIETTQSGDLYQHSQFVSVPSSLRRLNDIAFSGDGEPTTYRNFDEIIRRTAVLKAAHHLSDVKLVLITNASMFHRPVVQRGLALLDQNQGEIWAKLDAGTEAYFQLIERTSIPFQRILNNLTAAARVRPLVIQSLFLRLQGEPPSVAEIEAYIGCLRDIVTAGGQLQRIQIYSVARPPLTVIDQGADFVTALTTEELEAIGDRVRTATALSVEVFA